MTEIYMSGPSAASDRSRARLQFGASSASGAAAHAAGYGRDRNHAGARSEARRGVLSRVSLPMMVNVAGGVASLALIVGIGVWGYKLVMRDVSGIPVVQATEGPMRVAPSEPGGRPADHQGLSVNEVAGFGVAGSPADRVALAPNGVGLDAEDIPTRELQPAAPDALDPTANADGIVVADETQTPNAAMAADGEPSDEAIQALADQIAASTVLTDAVRTSSAQAVSPRPRVRPSGLGTRAFAASSSGTVPVRVSAAAEPTTAVVELDAAGLEQGTRLVQLGAYDSVEVARAEWGKAAERFAEYFDSKQRVIERAQSGGRTFYRLRVHGFDGLADARRFCAALLIERADCIPVVVR